MRGEKAAKPLTREQYMKKFSRAVRWQLGALEAADTIADYKEMVYQPERDESRLVEELGDPVQAAWLLTEAKPYRRWMKIFAILAAGLLMCAWWVWTALYWVDIYTWDSGFFNAGWRSIAVMGVGLVLSLVWFRRHGQKSGAVPRYLLLALAAVLVFAAVTAAVIWYVSNPEFLDDYAAMDGIPKQVVLLRELIMDGGVACTLAALAGLTLARCYDRRWLALYTLALTVAALCVFAMFTFSAMDLTFARAMDMRNYLFIRMIPVGIAGLIGTGVALC